jgi:hypothetical protein
LVTACVQRYGRIHIAFNNAVSWFHRNQRSEQERSFSGRLFDVAYRRGISFSVDGAEIGSVEKHLQGGKLFIRPARVLTASQSLIACRGASIVRIDVDEHPAVRAEEIELLSQGDLGREVIDEWRIGTTAMKPRGDLIRIVSKPRTQTVLWPVAVSI